MNNMYIIIGIVLVIAIMYFCNEKNNNKTESMASDGGALIQLNAKGPMDQYLISNANKYLYPYPYYYGVRPKRFFSRFAPYYPYYPYYSRFGNPYI